MICVEVPLRTLRNQIDALSAGSEPGQAEAFATGAMCALAWLLDPENNRPPVAVMLQDWCKPGIIQ